MTSVRAAPPAALPSSAPAQPAQAPEHRERSRREKLAAKVHHLVDLFTGSSRYVRSAHLPPYETLSPQALAQARAASPGEAVPLRALVDGRGGLHEPVTLHFHNSASEVTRALGRAGWQVAQPLSSSNALRSTAAITLSLVHLGKLIPRSFRPMPMDTLRCDGEPQSVGLEKNNTFFGRDHLRVYPLADGTCDVAPSRDIAASFNLKTFAHSHLTDRNFDPDRDMVMVDLLRAGEVQSWSVAQGVPSAEVAQALAHKQSDRQVYEVTLKTAED